MRILTWGFVGLALVSCGGGEPISDETSNVAIAPPCCKSIPTLEDVPHSAFLSGTTSILEPRLLVIRDMAGWADFWGQHTAGVSPAPTLPAVDFSRTMLAGVVIGQRPSDCYFVYARRVLWAPSASNIDHIQLEYHEQPPGIGCVPGPQGPASRFFLIDLPSTDIPIVFLAVE